MNYLIRRMTAADVDQVHALETATFPDPWSRDSFREEMEQNRCARYLVAERDGMIVAYAGAWMILEEGHITNVAVAASERGKGLGKAITAALMQYAANLGVQYMTLEVRKSNLVAQGLYQGLGFAALGVRKRYYENNGEDALLMVCQEMPEVQEEFEE
jgi:ribosomal-protein-alanine N-acetyltransferase